MESASPRAPDPELTEITLTREGELWVARDEETGVASQGETREEALAMLDEAVALHRGDIGEAITDEDLEALGIDPDEAPDKPEVPDAPWFDDEEP